MTHCGIICPASAGHLNPMMTLGYELKRRGHHVSAIGIFDVRSRVIAAGLEFVAIGKSEMSQTIDLSELAHFNGLKPFNYMINHLTT